MVQEGQKIVNSPAGVDGGQMYILGQVWVVTIWAENPWWWFKCQARQVRIELVKGTGRLMAVR